MYLPFHCLTFVSIEINKYRITHLLTYFLANLFSCWMKILHISSLAYLFLPAHRLIAWHIELLIRTSKLADKLSRQATEQQGNPQGGQSTKEKTIQMQTPDWVEEKDRTTTKYKMMKVKMLFKKNDKQHKKAEAEFKACRPHRRQSWCAYRLIYLHASLPTDLLTPVRHICTQHRCIKANILISNN